jgi:hypothetical protein
MPNTVNLQFLVVDMESYGRSPVIDPHDHISLKLLSCKGLSADLGSDGRMVGPVGPPYGLKKSGAWSVSGWR